MSERNAPFEIHGALSGYDGASKTQQNVGIVNGLEPSPKINLLLDTLVYPSLVVGSNPNNSSNVLSIATARADITDRDIGIGTFKTAISGILANADNTTTGAKTLLTTSATARTFVTGFYMSYVADVVCDSPAFTMQFIIPPGNTTRTFRLNRTPLTVGADKIFIEFPTPLELSKNQAITLNPTFTVGATTYSATILGYVVTS